jgi:hypothetical protein
MIARSKVRQALAAAAVALVAAPAAFAFFAEASQDRTVAFLNGVRASQDRLRFAGRKTVETSEGPAVYDLRADRPGRVHAEPVSKPPGRRGGWSGRSARGRFTDPALIAENYRLETRAGGKIAGRDADRFALIPRHSGRAAYEVAVDRQNRFMLAFRAVAADGTKLYDSRFESITFDPAPRTDEKAPPKPSSTRPAPDRQRRVVRETVKESDLRGAMPFAVFTPEWVPPGFKLRSIERYVIRDLGEAVLARWSDGMVGIHIIQTDAANPAWELFRGAYLSLPEAPPPATSGGGPVAWRMKHPGGALLDLELDGTEVLIGGQVDPDELKKMADHLRKLESPSHR